MQKIWVLGDAVVDLLPEGEGRLLQCPGGAPANVAVGIARLGGKSAFIGRVGDDPFGRFMHKTLADEQVDVNWMRLDPAHRTSTVVVDLDEQGERSFTFMVRPSADLFLASADLPPFSAGEWLHVCSIALSAEPSRSATFQAMNAVREAGVMSVSTPISARISGRMRTTCAAASNRRCDALTSSNSPSKNWLF